MSKSPHDPNELFAPERPVRSDFARQGSGLSYKTRRLITLVLLIVIMLGGGAWLWGRLLPSTPGEIPTIKAEGSYKERPEQPGGIDIPHQDVQVYHEIDGSASAENTKTTVEHMLPPPETPTATPATTPAGLPETNANSTVENLAPEVPAEMTVGTTALTQTTQPSVKALPELAVAPAPAIAKAVTQPPPTVTPAPAKFAETKAAPSSGSSVVQLAALPDEHAANAMAQKLQAKYQSILGAAKLHPVRADLGSKGIFYRIQSQGLSDAEAKNICAAMKKQNAGCILVHH